jgi:hypothetical protein
MRRCRNSDLGMPRFIYTLNDEEQLEACMHINLAEEGIRQGLDAGSNVS